MIKIKVRSTVSVIGLKAGEQAEIELTDLVRSLLRAGLLQALRPV